jgi:hypothetical protein
LIDPAFENLSAEEIYARLLQKNNVSSHQNCLIWSTRTCAAIPIQPKLPLQRV